MKIKELKVLRGPNIWSTRRQQLVQMILDIGAYEHQPTNTLAEFTDRLVDLIPSLHTHRCSEGVEGGFISRMKEGTWLGHVVEHVALEIQTLAGMDCGFGRTRSTGEHAEYFVVVSYLTEEAGNYAIQAAVDIVQALAEGKSVDLRPVIGRLAELYHQEKLGPSTQCIVDAAIEKGIPWRRLDNESYIQFGQGKNQRRIRATVTDATSNIAVECVQEKHFVKTLLADNGIPVPEGKLVNELDELYGVIAEIGFPLVIKPNDGNHGRGVTTRILDYQTAKEAFIKAKLHANDVIVERYIQGDDYRFLLINYQLVAVAKRTPATVIGDGTSGIAQLIEAENARPERGVGHQNILTQIIIDEQVNAILQEHQFTLDTVLPQGTILQLKKTANLSTGGTAEDVTASVPTETRLLMERVARLIQLDICGIDVISTDIRQEFRQETAAILEINAAPGFRMHSHPSIGQARPVGQAVIDMLFPKGHTGRIPVVGITGTNGKTTTTRLLAHLASVNGLKVGCTTTEGIYINGHCIEMGDCSGPKSAQLVLADPIVEYAVLECARGGMLRRGLGFDRCDISIVTNVAEDHLGINHIHTLQDLTKVKAILPEATSPTGLAILNAQDSNVYHMQNKVRGRVALFSLDSDQQELLAHFSNGGMVCYLEGGWIYIGVQGIKTRLIEAADIPLTVGGKYSCMIQNVMAATLAALESGFTLDIIRQGLKTFLPTPEMNLGRMNEFWIAERHLLVDYVHNPHGFAELKKFIDKITATEKIGIITATGDRRDQDIMEIGRLSAQIFDRLIIRHDKDCRGRSPEAISKLLTEGIHSVDKMVPVTYISDEREALNYALEHSESGALILLCSDDSRTSLRYAMEIKQVEDQKLKYYGT
ncbi:hypothetical protein AAW12_18840 [Sphingobacterium sp. Ag1]|uniref:cyanophycin synthetase n=1 Tax=Sphingobacterium sp. Ag1 TaxID=1643451 RepID=UPI000627C473|nr:cyanophycin synthetase [Sphingobacterium sp. Ag1]KKO90009.1 hypothetical protein AAW12_18840 [Sphingobacterium sp. Ag1]